MIFKGKGKKEEIDQEEEQFLERFREVEAPILILDERWLRIFPDNYKTKEILRLEKELRDALKYQARLTQNIKDAEDTKKKLMERIIQFMNAAQISAAEAKKQEKSQEYIKNINSELKDLELKYEQMPDHILELNQQLLIESLRVCYRRMKQNKEQLDEQKRLVMEAKKVLQEHEERRRQLHIENEHIFTFMHKVFGRSIIELFDEFDDEEDELE